MLQIKKNNFFFTKSITDEDGFIQITKPPCVYKLESLDNEIRRIIIGEERYTEAIYPFLFKPNFNTLASIVKIISQGPIITFVPQ